MHGEVNIVPPLPILFALVAVGLVSMAVLACRKNGEWAEALAAVGCWAVAGLLFGVADWHPGQAVMAGCYWMTGVLFIGAVSSR